MVTPYWKIYFGIREYSEDGRRRINDVEKLVWEERLGAFPRKEMYKKGHQ